MLHDLSICTPKTQSVIEKSEVYTRRSMEHSCLASYKIGSCKDRKC